MRVFALANGQLGMVITIHAFGEHLGFNCHLHALLADGLFSPASQNNDVEARFVVDFEPSSD